jgi:hypothetical protein
LRREWNDCAPFSAPARVSEGHAIGAGDLPILVDAGREAARHSPFRPARPCWCVQTGLWVGVVWHVSCGPAVLLGNHCPDSVDPSERSDDRLGAMEIPMIDAPTLASRRG